MKESWFVTWFRIDEGRPKCISETHVNCRLPVISCIPGSILAGGWFKCSTIVCSMISNIIYADK